MFTETRSMLTKIRISMKQEGVEIGRASLVLVSNDLHDRPYGLLEDVFIHPDHRGKGHAKSLVRAIIKRAREEDCYKLIATSRTERESAHRLYLKLAFKFYGYEFRLDF